MALFLPQPRAAAAVTRQARRVIGGLVTSPILLPGPKKVEQAQYRSVKPRLFHVARAARPAESAVKPTLERPRRPAQSRDTGRLAASGLGPKPAWSERGPPPCYSVEEHRGIAQLTASRIFRTRTGEMAEWLKAHAWKACLGETLTWVRIPLSPPV